MPVVPHVRGDHELPALPMGDDQVVAAEDSIPGHGIQKHARRRHRHEELEQRLATPLALTEMHREVSTEPLTQRGRVLPVRNFLAISVVAGAAELFQVTSEDELHLGIRTSQLKQAGQ